MSGGPSTGGDSIGELPPGLDIRLDALLQLEVPLRSFRSPALNDWVASILLGHSSKAGQIASALAYPIGLTGELAEADDQKSHTTIERYLQILNNRLIPRWLKTQQW